MKAAAVLWFALVAGRCVPLRVEPSAVLQVMHALTNGPCQSQEVTWAVEDGVVNGTSILCAQTGIAMVESQQDCEQVKAALTPPTTSTTTASTTTTTVPSPAGP